MSKTNVLKLKEMFDSQVLLNKKIFENPNTKTFETEMDFHHAIRLALIAEMGEFLNERPDLFKYWKTNTHVNHKKALEEWVDVWHFAMTLALVFSPSEEDRKALYESLGKAFESADALEHTTVQKSIKDFTEVVASGWRRGLVRVIAPALLDITNGLGYTFEEVYEAYCVKNKVNHDRQEMGY